MIALLVNMPAAVRAEKLPNPVIILADDLGYGDLGCYGARLVKTPNVDRLAREGVRFTDAHSTASVCTPTRCGNPFSNMRSRANLSLRIRTMNRRKNCWRG